MLYKNFHYDMIKLIDKELKRNSYPNCSSLVKRSGIWKDRKTIFNIIDSMKSDLKAPIEYDRKKRGYYYTDTSFNLLNVYLERREFILLKIIAKYITEEFGDSIAKDFENITNKVLPNSQELTNLESSDGFLENISFNSNARINIDKDTLYSLIDSIIFSNKIKVQYLSQQKDYTERIIHPYSIIYKSGVWHLVAFCELRKAERLFALHGFKKIIPIQNEYFEKPEKIKLLIGDGVDSISGTKQMTVRILIKPGAANFVKDRIWQKNQQIDQEKDGSIIITFKVNTLNNIQRWILSFGADAVALSPKILIDNIKSISKAIQANYN